MKSALLACITSNIEPSEKTFEFKFHLDPFKEQDNVGTDYATFDEYNHLLDHYMPIADRKYLWYMFQLQRTIDTVAKLEMAFIGNAKTPAEGEETWDEIAIS